MMMNWWGYPYPGGFGWIFMIFWWIIIIAGIAVFARWVSHGHGGCGHRHEDKSPLETLKERYAKGEIDKKEYEEKKKDLG